VNKLYTSSYQSRKGIFHRTTCYICNAITKKERNESKGWEGCLHYKSSCSWNEIGYM